MLFQYQYPKFVYSFYSACYLLVLGDYNPPYLEIIVPKNYRPFPLPRERVIVHIDTKKDTFSLGIIEVEKIFVNKVKVYNKEKTVSDFIKNRNKIDSETFVKCINY